MRIVSGKYGGRKFNPPAKIPARPTTDLAKEGLFNVLQNMIDLEGIAVLELFAGTGNVSYEFASRGASAISLVERDNASIQFIINTFEALGFTQYKIWNSDALKLLKILGQKYDVIFADPPYALPQMPLLPDLIFENNLLNEGGLFILEHTHNVDFSKHPQLIKSKKYGDSFFSIFQ